MILLEYKPDVRFVQFCKFLLFHFVNTGSPHCIVFMEENPQLGQSVVEVDVNSLGRQIRRDGYFLPEGTNVSFVGEKGPGSYDVRTYERGVEAETLACGTGSVATALLAHRVKAASPPINIFVKSGERLIVDFVPGKDDRYENVSLTGSAHFSFSGILEYDISSNSMADKV